MTALNPVNLDCPLCGKQMTCHVREYVRYADTLTPINDKCYISKGVAAETEMLYHCNDCRIEMTAKWKSRNRDFDRMVLGGNDND